MFEINSGDPSPSPTENCFQNPHTSVAECRVFLTGSPVDNSKTIVLSKAGMLFALRSVKEEQLKHAEKSNVTC